MPVVTLTSDFGLQDSYVAEVKAVLLKVKPQIVDISHMVLPHDIGAGAFQLLRSYRYFPKGTCHLAVVDPSVGTLRKCIYVKTQQYHFVGPDNGVLLWAVNDCERKEKKKAKIFEIPVPDDASATFHGRDVFAPFIVSLFRNRAKKLKVLPTLKGEEFPGSRELDGAVRGEVVAQDHFGNIITSVPIDFLADYEAQIGDGEDRYQTAKNYAAIPEEKVGLVRGSHGYWELSCQQRSAWEKLRVRVGDEVTLFPTDSV